MGQTEKWECLFWGLIKLAQDATKADICTDSNITIQAISNALFEIIRTGKISDLKYTSQFEGCEYAAIEVSKKSECVVSTGKSDILSQLLGMYCPSYAYQGDMIYLVSNTLVISGLAGYKNLEKNTSLIGPKFQNKLNISYEDYYKFLFCLYSMSLKDMSLNKTVWLNNSPRKSELESDFENVLKDLALDINKLNHDQINFASPFAGKTRAESIFTRYPILSFKENGFTFAGHAYLKVLLTRKFIQKVIYSFSGNERDQIRDFLSNRFETFVGELLSSSNTDKELVREIEYIKDKKFKNVRSVDWLLLEKENEKLKRICLIDAKFKTLNENTLYSYSSESFLKEISGSYSKAIYQGIKFLYNVDYYLARNEIKDEFTDLAKKINTISNVVLIGVSPDIPSVFTIKNVRDELMTSLLNYFKTKNETNVWDWFSNKYNGKWCWHIIEVNELQIYLTSSLKRKIHLGKEIQSYLKLTNIDKKFIESEGIPVNFRTYLINKYGEDNGANKRLKEYFPELTGTFDEFVKSISTTFGFSVNQDAKSTLSTSQT